MKFVWMFSALIFLSACAHDREDQALLLRPLEAPVYINGDLAAVFGKQNFVARAEATTGAATVTGNLAAANGSLFFSAGEISVLWDDSAKAGYLCSEPLQGYAPMRALTNEAAAFEQTEAGLPSRVEIKHEGKLTTLRLSRVRIGAAGANLFALPNGFKKYESTDLMGRELMVRRRDSLDARSRARREKFGTGTVDDVPVQPKLQHY